MKLSHLLTKTKKDVSAQETSINAQLLERAGYVNKLMAGVYSYLPLGLRVLFNIETIVREEMDSVGGQEVLLPALQPREIWDTTGRWDSVDVLYKLKAHDRDLCLGATHEEVITPLVGHYIQSYKDLPRSAYQIQTKFRNEARPKSGILRGREFRMKDMYSFHLTQTDLEEYYEKVTQAYIRIFKRCGVGDITYFTIASGGVFSKEFSHEFQTLTPYGEDRIFVCKKCHIAINHEVIEQQPTCPSCNTKDFEESKSIEVGNIFKLGTKYSDACKLFYTDKEGKQHPAVMGCYGLGTSRLMGALVEALHDDKGIIWSKEVAPYLVHLIVLGKEAEHQRANQFYDELQRAGLSVLFDDRDMQAGAKFADADLLGMPVRVVISQKTLAQNSVEIKLRKSAEAQLVPVEKVIEQIKKLLV